MFSTVVWHRQCGEQAVCTIRVHHGRSPDQDEPWPAEEAMGDWPPARMLWSPYQSCVQNQWKHFNPFCEYPLLTTPITLCYATPTSCRLSCMLYLTHTEYSYICACMLSVWFTVHVQYEYDCANVYSYRICSTLLACKLMCITSMSCVAKVAFIWMYRIT